jgi:Glycosyltransferase
MKQTEHKKILVITHQLSRTGAPIVLLDMMRAYWRKGYQLEVIAMMDGELRKDIEEMGVPLKVQEHFLQQSEEFFAYVGGFDFVVANTLITFEAVHLLKYLKVPVLWWLHEGRQYFEYFANVLPDFRTLPHNIHVFSVGHYVQEVIEQLYGVHTEILHFGVADSLSHEIRQTDDKKARFLTAGTYSRVKAQDVLAEAIRSLPEDYLARAEFFFCGNEQMYDELVFLPVKQLCGEYENVTLLHQLSRRETLAWMEKCHCLIVPSRVDPIPTVAVEMMMKGNLCLCTDVCGIAHYMKDGVNGFTAPPDDSCALADKIKYVIDYCGELEPLCQAGREVYEKYFSMDVFEKNIMELAERYVQQKGSKGAK